MSEKITFDELLGFKWEFSNNNERENYFLKVIKENGEDVYDNINMGVLIIYEQCWGEHKPASFHLNESDNIKVKNLFLYSKEMYKLINSVDDDKFRELIKKINNIIP